MCASIRVSDWATEVSTLLLVLPALPLPPARLSEPSSRMFSAGYVTAGPVTVAVGVAMLASLVSTAGTLRAWMPASAVDLITHSVPVTTSSRTATTPTAARAATHSPLRRSGRRRCRGMCCRPGLSGASLTLDLPPPVAPVTSDGPGYGRSGDAAGHRQ